VYTHARELAADWPTREAWCLQLVARGQLRPWDALRFVVAPPPAVEEAFRLAVREGVAPRHHGMTGRKRGSKVRWAEFVAQPVE